MQLKKFLFLLGFFFASLPLFAAHITGGEVTYEFVRNGSNSKFYKITLTLFRDNNCVGCAALPGSVAVALYDNANLSRLGDIRFIGLQSEFNLPILAAPSCLTNAPMFNYSGGTYSTEIELMNNAAGYTFVYQTCCRVKNIVNLTSSSTGGDQGSTYISTIPGTDILGSVLNDKSAFFQTGISIICYNKKFTLDFSAKDPDGDSLVYRMCDALDGGAAQDASYSNPASPPYNAVGYSSPFSGFEPLGSLASIESSTGIISGIAPALAGKYVVSVCVSSYRNGRFMNEHRKDFIVTVSPCDFAGAELDLAYSNCKDSTFTFINNNNSPLNKTYKWYFGDGASSTDQSPTHTYSDTGRYSIKLVVNGGQECADSATSFLSVFPFFLPKFTSTAPVCKGIEVKFTDQTIATYRPVNKWVWNFGDRFSTSNTDSVQNPKHTYQSVGTYIVKLTSSSLKGCKDTVSGVVNIVDKPNLKLPNDTLICIIDTLRLSAKTEIAGTIVWSPNYNISDINSLNPLVSPDVTTTYTATFTDRNGCSNTASVKVNVISSVSLSTMADTTICRTDSVQLRILSDGLSFNWTPPATLNNSKTKIPTASPADPSTLYTVTATVGKCFNTKSITVRTVPYPMANAGPDTTICYQDNAALSATGGSIYTWSPAVFLNNPNIPNPVAVRPTATVQYVVTVRDVLGCPKPVTDTVLVKVKRIVANAGPRDTSIVLGQPLQLTGTGAEFYTWSPSTYLDNNSIFNPLSNPKDSITYILRVFDEQGCDAFDTISVRVYRVAPSLYVPSAFTPNGNGINDDFKPIALGIRSLESFRVYNRYGDLVYRTSVIGNGWNGMHKGAPQGTGTFVWYAEATDYTGKKIKEKGTVVLVR